MRHVLRLGAFACVASLLAACGGGGGSRVVPQTSQNAGPAQASGAVAPVPSSAARGILVSVHLPLRNDAQLDALLKAQGDRNAPEYRHWLTPAQFRAQFGPSNADLTSVANALEDQGFTTHVTSQGVLADAPQATVERTFHVTLSARTTKSGRTVMGTNRAPTLPDALARANASVSFGELAYDTLAQFAALPNGAPAGTPVTDNRYSADGPYWFTDLKEAYGYPSYADENGAGRTIGIVISSDVSDGDVALYFGHEHFTPPPAVERRPVNGGAPFTGLSGAGPEASLDVQQSLGSAPGAHLLLYTVPTLSFTNVVAAYQAVVDDNRADVVSSSFGICELYYTASYGFITNGPVLLQQQHDLFRQGNAQGITFVAASGDSGAYGCVNNTATAVIKGVIYPASDPDVTAVGGTNLVTSFVPGSRTSTYVSENANDDALTNGGTWGSGGGISLLFGKPWYQYLVATGASTRTIPDVAMHMGGCPVGSVQPCGTDRSSDVTAIGGKLYLVIGTSASSPEFAGLLAVAEQRLGGVRMGNANGYIYLTSAVFGNAMYRQNIPGNNGYPATPGYNYVLGNGTPHANVFAADPNGPVAGDPFSASNP